LQRAFRGRYLLIEQDRGILGRDLAQSCAFAVGWPTAAMVGTYAVACGRGGVRHSIPALLGFALRFVLPA
jgi:hypothetical protein